MKEDLQGQDNISVGLIEDVLAKQSKNFVYTSWSAGLTFISLQVVTTESWRF